MFVGAFDADIAHEPFYAEVKSQDGMVNSIRRSNMKRRRKR